MAHGIQAPANGVLQSKHQVFESGSGVDNGLIRRIVFDYPDRLVEPTAWVGHIPFAFWLINVHRPNLFVELGTHTGNSYSAFAQAVQRLALPTACYAVDTWKGDEHAGFYGNSVFEEFSSYHDARYRSFSQLLRMTFDEALGYFKDGSIDLLHIDGSHTAEAVKHDFDTWLPKLSERAVVLLHDVNVRANNFGVWDLWVGLAGRYPQFRFDHSHGLGVLGVGAQFTPELNWLFSLSGEAPSDVNATYVRSFFSALGGALLDSSALRTISTELEGGRRERERITRNLGAAHIELKVLRKERLKARGRVERLESEKHASDRELASLRHSQEMLLEHLERFEPRNYKGTIIRALLKGLGLLHRTGPSKDLGRLVDILSIGTTGYLLGQSSTTVKVLLTACHPFSRRRRHAHYAHYAMIKQRVDDIVTLFDERFYLSNYPDVAASTTDALLHYLKQGWKEDRQPHPLFDIAYYKSRATAAGIAVQGNPVLHFLENWSRLRINPNPVFDGNYYIEVNSDVQHGGSNPLIHYIRWGRNEGRQPSRQFHPATYLFLNPDVDLTGIDPFDHYVRFGHSEGRRLLQTSIHDLLPSAPPEPLTPPDVRVDVVVPIYGGVAETRRCLESVLHHASDNATLGRIIVVNDCGPDPAIHDYLDELRVDKKVLVLDNQKNLGFVASANRGMAYAEPNDVVLLNSDTEVSGDWIDRLAAHAQQDASIGSVTPFTNNGTICSYPTMAGHAKLPAGETVRSLDAAFQKANSGKSVDLPTAVGFCMYIKRSCIEANGLFDVETFGRGYGEENDFCLRSAAGGWRHILAGDVFVYHAGETSFGAESGRRKEEAMAVLRARYPSYIRDVSRFVSDDKLAALRIAATGVRFGQGNRPVVLMLVHRLGGGTEKHAMSLVDQFGGIVKFLFLRIEGESNFTLFSPESDDALSVTFRADSPRDLAQLIRGFGVQRIHVHHFVGYNKEVRQFLMEVGVPYDLTVHDYMLICPRIQLFQPKATYCGEPDEFSCLSCLQINPPGLSTDILSWRWQGRELLEGATRVICPSRDTAARMSRYVENVTMLVAPHEDPVLFRQREIHVPLLTLHEAMRIVVLGHVSDHKGGNFLIDCVSACRRIGVAATFTVIGELPPLSDVRDEAIREMLHVTGSYGANEIDDLITVADPHLIFFPQRWPETYSYTLSEGLRSGAPLLVPKLGAFPERVAGLPWCWLYDISLTAEEFAALLGTIRKESLEPNRWVSPPSSAQMARDDAGAREWFYANEFLAWSKHSGDTTRARVA